MNFAELIQSRRILICVGSGGVGKTTTAATFALAGARAGKRTLVMTIDPAKRLANALGLERLDHEQRRVPDEKIALPGETVKGTLHAMMLDQKRAFDEMVEKDAPTREVVERIRKNRIYQQVSSTLTGSHEYAAMAKLFEVSKPKDGAPRYDLIVLDTPPTANALDFLDAPSKLVGAIDSPALQWFVKPYLEGKSFSMQLVGFWGGQLLKRLAKFVGSRFLEDIAQFVGEFNSVLADFRARANSVIELLRQPEVGFVVVCSPAPLSVDEALHFHDRLRTSRMSFGGFVINRVHPRGPAAPDRGVLVETLEERPELRGFAGDDVVQAAADIARTYGEFQALAEIDHRQVERVRSTDPSAHLVEVPLFDRDIYDVEGLSLVATYLLGQ